MEPFKLNTEALLGPLNEVEAKFAPPTLYLLGDPEMLRLSSRVSIVGSRKASPDGLRRAARLSKVLAEQGIVIVSGLAEGIDTAAHTAAIDAGGHTTAVIGTPLDQFYPRSNRALQEQLASEQLVLSQFPIGMPVQKKNFILRNRTMALISDATVIMEAGETSGSHSQGWEALRLGRPLYIANSIVDNADLEWPEKMLAYGAQVLSEKTLPDLISGLPNRAPGAFANAILF